METELLRAYRRLRAGLPLSSRMTRIAGGALETNATVLAALDQPEDAPCMLLQPPYLLQPLMLVSGLTLSFSPHASLSSMLCQPHAQSALMLSSAPSTVSPTPASFGPHSSLSQPHAMPASALTMPPPPQPLMLASIPTIAPAPHQPQSSCWPTGVAFCLGGRLTQQGLHHVCLVSPAGDHVMDHLSVVGRKSMTHQQLTAPALATILGFHDSPPVPCCNAPRSRRPPRPVRRAPRPSPYAGRRLRFAFSQNL